MKTAMAFKIGLALGTIMLASPAWAAGFGFTAGPQIEERMGSEYGAEYYYRRSRFGPKTRRHKPNSALYCSEEKLVRADSGGARGTGIQRSLNLQARVLVSGRN